MKVCNIGQLTDYQQREIMDLFFPKQEVKYNWVNEKAEEKVEATTPVRHEAVSILQKEAVGLAEWYLQGDGITDYHMYMRNPTIHVKIGNTFEESYLYLSGLINWRGKEVTVHAGLDGVETVEWKGNNHEAADVALFYDEYDCACNDVLVFIWSCYNEV